jgi:DinB superfamily
MPHPLIVQLRFTRSEFQRGLEGLSDADARRRLLPMNCISWNIGHLACHEQGIWLADLQGHTPLPHLNELYGYGQPASTPPLAESLEAWQTVTKMVDPFLDTLTTQHLQEMSLTDEDDPHILYTAGSLMQRLIYHYWYHNGENMAIRQMLGHTILAEFVGDIDSEAPYRPH